MAIVTGNYKGFTFGDISSKAYGVYITQEAAYNAPERDVSVYEIAGRNGAYVLDNGRFRNITVTYKCGIALDTETDFASAIRVFRNALASKAGKYVRLTDEYNPDEFRQAAFLGGIEVEIADRRAGEFNVSFDCKPQRFLTSGETAVAVTSGGTITNPTLFEARPLLQVWGYGNIVIGGETINIQNTPIGRITVGSSGEDAAPVVIEFNGSQLENGDTISISRVEFMTIVGAPSGKNFDGDSAFTTSPYFTPQDDLSAGGYWNVYFSYAPQTFVKGTANNKNTSFTATYGLNDGTDNTVQYSVTYSYDGDNKFTFSVTITPQATQYKSATCSWSEIVGDSTKSSLGNPLYIDLDIGEAYKVEGGRMVGVNNAVSLPAELPALKTGATAITFDNTITELHIVPRWWEV